MTFVITTADAGTLDNHILNDSILSVSDERCRYTKAIAYLPLDSTLKRSCLGADRYICSKVAG